MALEGKLIAHWDLEDIDRDPYRDAVGTSHLVDDWPEIVLDDILDAEEVE